MRKQTPLSKSRMSHLRAELGPQVGVFKLGEAWPWCVLGLGWHHLIFTKFPLIGKLQVKVLKVEDFVLSENKLKISFGN